MDTAATITVRIRFPSHTKRRGARADFGRLFKSTRNGSKIWAAKGLDQRKRAVKRLIRVHKRKLKRVSVKVTPVWRKRLLSRSMFHRQKRIWEGELKIKRLIRPREAVSSQRDKNRIRIIIRRSGSGGSAKGGGLHIPAVWSSFISSFHKVLK